MADERDTTPDPGAIPSERMESARKFRDRFINMWRAMAAVQGASGSTYSEASQAQARNRAPSSSIAPAAVDSDLQSPSTPDPAGENSQQRQPENHEDEDDLYHATPRAVHLSMELQQNHPAAARGQKRKLFETQEELPATAGIWALEEGAKTLQRDTLKRTSRLPAASKFEEPAQEEQQTKSSLASRPVVKRTLQVFGNHASLNEATDDRAQPARLCRNDETLSGRGHSTVEDADELEAPAVTSSNLARPLPPSIFISSQGITRDPRRLLFVLELDDEELDKHTGPGAWLLQASCAHAWDHHISVQSFQHGARLYSVLFETARKANESEGMEVMLLGCPVVAEKPHPGQPSSFFWLDERDQGSDGEIERAVREMMVASEHEVRLYTQSVGWRTEFVIFFEGTPHIIRLGLPFCTKAGEVAWAWFHARDPRRHCRVCHEIHPARCHRVAKWLL